MEISVVIPVYNEKDNVSQLHREIIYAIAPLKREFEIIFVDDASEDGTFEVLSMLPSPVKIIRFRRNRGQTAALDVGIKKALGTLVVTIDGDLQNDPSDIPRLIDKLESENLDVVSGWRKDRKDSFMKCFISKVAKLFRDKLIKDGIHDSGCTLKVYKRSCFKTVDLYGEIHRFIVAILRMKGYKVGELVVKHRSRIHGKTKYNFSRTLKGFLDMLAIWFWGKFSNRPLHFLGGTAFVMVSFGIISGICAVYLKLFKGIDLSDTAFTLLSMFMFFGGLIMFILGIMADMLSKIYYNASKDEVYLIEKIIEKRPDGLDMKDESGIVKQEVKV